MSAYQNDLAPPIDSTRVRDPLGRETDKPLEERVSNTSANDAYLEKQMSPLEAHVTDSSQDRRIIRRVDWHVLPWLAILYAWSLIDRTNMGNARIEGMQAELRLDIGARYSIALLVFFPFYFIVELPATLLIRKVQPRIFISAIAVMWGLVMLCMGFVKSWGALAVCRGILGALEGGFFPACVYLISSWYKRYELQKRISTFYMLGVLASGLSSILAYGLARIGPQGNYQPWSFIFFIEGALTMVLGAISYFFIAGFPTNRERCFLTPQDQDRVLYRIQQDRDDAEHDPLTGKKLAGYLLEWKAWVFSIMFMSSTVTSYALSYFLPVILLFRLGFSLVEAQCLAAPPYVFAIFFAMTSATFSDKYKIRAPFIIIHSLVCIIGLAVLYAGDSIPTGVQYFAVFLACAGTNANVPAVIGYMQNNIHTSSRRATLSALQVGFGAIGGIFGSTVFRQSDSPTYRPGLLACILCNVFIIGACILFSFLFSARNKKQEQGAVLEGKVGFRYAL